MLVGLKFTFMQMHAGMCVVFSALAFLYMTALNIIAYCDDLQGLMSAYPQELRQSNVCRRLEAPTMTIDCPAEGHQPQHQGLR